MMVRTGFYILQIIVLFLLVSCLFPGDTSEKGSLKETQDKIAQEGVDYIKDPMDKAKQVAELVTQHTQNLKMLLLSLINILKPLLS
ncbi:MAG: hypothetical protein ACI8ZB_003510 [Desulforhopalus sp.]|jgi:hypothetical protein